MQQEGLLLPRNFNTAMHAVDDRKRSGSLCIIILQHFIIAIANKFHPSDFYVLLMAVLIRWVQLIQRQYRGRFQINF